MPPYDEWLKTVPSGIKSDSLWRVRAYRLSLYMADAVREDVDVLSKRPLLRGLVHQLYRAVNSIGANIAEGYSHVSGRERAKFYEYALGSAREARDWYYKSRHDLSKETVQARMAILDEIIRLLIVMVSQQRSAHQKDYQIREEPGTYIVGEE
ncbi:MAG: four helix bundle protein [Chloroflexi bacterium]|nr:four helix bundle protein [Chloroflexota bacterium]